MSHQRGFTPIILVLIGLLIVGGLAGAYYLGTQKTSNPAQVYTQTSSLPKSVAIQPSASDETAGWKTYVSSKYGYSFKYPLDLQVDDKQSPYSAILNIASEQPGLSGFPSYYVSVIPNGFDNRNSEVYNFLDTQIINKAFSIEEGKSFDSRPELPSNKDFWYFKKLTNVNMSGMSGVVIEDNKVWSGRSDLKDRRVLIRKGDYIYEIGCYYTTDQELRTFNKFLEGFKFQ